MIKLWSNKRREEKKSVLKNVDNENFHPHIYNININNYLIKIYWIYIFESIN